MTVSNAYVENRSRCCSFGELCEVYDGGVGEGVDNLAGLVQVRGQVLEQEIWPDGDHAPTDGAAPSDGVSGI